MGTVRVVDRRGFIAAISSALVVLLSGPAAAWNAKGHMTVAAAAWKRMSPEARANAFALLQLNPDAAGLLDGVRPEDRQVGLFLKAATWPDEIKSTYTKDGNAPPGRASDAQNIGYADCLQHRYWHFKDIPFSRDGTPLRDPPEPDAVTQIRAFAAALADPRTSDDVKSYDLAWLLHLVGDIHQPLHATARFTRDDPDGDGGGNGVQLCIRGKPCSDRWNTLHGFWDNALGNSESITSALKLACVTPETGSLHCLPEPDASAATVTDPEAWAHASFMLAQEVAYRRPVGPSRGPYYATEAYRVRVGSTAEQQVALAGARLANLLETALATGVTRPVAAPPLATASTCPRAH